MGKSTFGQALQALNLIHAKDPSSERLTALYNSGLLSDLLDADPTKIDREAFRASLIGGARVRSTAGKRKLLASTTLGSTPGTEPFMLTVEYADLEVMIASGNYDWKNDNITSSRFPAASTSPMSGRLTFPSKRIFGETFSSGAPGNEIFKTSPAASALET